ncbi:glycoside hydrolase [Candidatus Magnetobacterium bavaricum]|uniref:Glycoside hydrolase n=1 Tax=Candidatus Magnetobacterium bavaricum TaxID=29290 RepID=A0A0F3GYJ0_9BACT|nr:glycoside hydrolase [Candidatus Magnetobacterium bavaricum]
MRKVLVFALLLFVFGCTRKAVVREDVYKPPVSKEEAPQPTPQPVPKTPHDILRENIPQMSSSFLGAKYKFGANPDDDPSYTDCSHLICAVIRKSLAGSDYEFKPYYFSTDKIYESTYKIEQDDVKPGDIIFFKDVKRQLSHLGVVNKITHDNITFIHASSQAGVIERSTNSESWYYYWHYRFDSFRRWKDEVFARKKYSMNSE